MYSAMIGIDTNVLLRVIIADEPKQAEAARNFIRDNCSSDDPGYVSHITLVELVWTLAKAYQFSREDISRAVEQILETAQLDVESSNDVAAALKEYRKGPADFADCLLARVNAAAGCDYTITFDRKAAKLTGFKLLPAR
jgi:predicted nucleic-acid-binding protein